MKLFGVEINPVDIIKAVVITAAVIYTGGLAASALGVGSAIGVTAALAQAGLAVGASLVLGALSGKSSVGDPGRLISQRNPTESRKVIYGRTRVAGSIVAMGTSSTNRDVNKFLHMYIALATHEVEKIESIYFDDQRVWFDNNGVGTYDTASDFYSAPDGEAYFIDTRLGGSDNATFIPPNTDNNLGGGETGDTDLSSVWTASHTLNDVAYVYVRLRYEPERFRNGIPNITAVVQGKKVFDSSSNSTGYSDNPAWCLLDYLRNDYYGLNISDDEIDFPSFEAAAVICAQQVDLDGGGQESRYTCNGLVDLVNKPEAIISSILTSFSGEMFYTNGKFSIKAGAYVTPTLSFDESNIFGEISAITKPSVRDGYNAVKGLYAEPSFNWQPVEYPTATSSLYSTIDGYESFISLDLNFTTSNSMAQRLAKIALNKSRQEVQVTFSSDLSTLQLSVGDTFYLTSSKLGYTNKVFQVTEMNIDLMPALGVTVSAVEVSPSTYDWSASEQEALISEDSFYESEFALSPPSNITFTSEVLQKLGQPVSWELSWDASTSVGVTGYVIEWKRSGETVYNSGTSIETSLKADSGVIAGDTYDIRIRAVGVGGRQSDSATTTVTVAQDTLSPSNVTGLSVTGVPEGLKIAFNEVTTNSDSSALVDLKDYRIAYSTTNNESTATQRFINATETTISGLTASTQYYVWVRARDFSGNLSASPDTAVVTTGDGLQGPEGASGERGSGLYVFDAGASSLPTTQSALNSAFTSTSGHAFPISKDRLALHNDAGDGELYEYDGSNWQDAGAFISGDLIVEGTITTDRLNSGNTDGQYSFTIGNTTTLGGLNFDTSFISSGQNASGGTTYSLMTGSLAGKGFVSQIVDSFDNGYAAGEFYNSISLFGTSHRNYALFATRNNAIEASGNVSITGNLTVSGTTPTASSVSVGSTSSSATGFPLIAASSGSITPDVNTGFLYRPSANQLGVGEGVGTIGQLPNGAINASVYYKGGAFLAFTEGHDSLLPSGHQAQVGDIIVDNGVAHKKDIDNVICFGALSNVADQKAVIGVYTQDSNLVPIALRIPNENQQVGEDSQILDPDLSHLLDSHQQVRVNSLGEGQINVCGEGGNIEAGDLIVTSSMAGKGMKQSDDIIRSITVAKARESIVFSSATEVQSVACIYLCG